ncbi:HNH endonuclease signature motif containing protein [Corynebacterium breve]|uniref:HNH endonuclease signature motif containing protein n=1 Tax=Corynebacterium breve TaxID=3049799 RepID=A0ABY8VB49_9CORY|nr:HNH endonuclease signature motif containing protein [Corynebacterium breve]WIM66841.1 HNH endonuclease signature motif containing protein [Corynebacterium breve]
MNILQTHASLGARAMELLTAASGMSVSELCRMGFDVVAAKQLARLAEVYFAPTKSTRKQAQAQESARRNGHTLNTLELIERHVKRLRKKSDAWRLRLSLCQRDPDIYALRQHAKQEVERLNGPEKPAEARTEAHVSNPSSRLDRTIHLTGPEHKIAAIVDRADEYAKEHSITRAEALLALFGTGGGTRVTPALIISLGDAQAVADGDDVVLSLTNGSRMSGKDFVQAALTAHGLAMLVDPVRGPVNLYRTSRFASAKQRTMASLENPVCAWPGCGKGADSCQINHNMAWKHGGQTNIDNLSTACSFHNGINDDNRAGPHLDRRNGQIRRIPRAGPPELNDHPTARGGAMRII